MPRLFVLLALLLPFAAWADGLVAEQGWIRQVPPVTAMSAGYLRLKNDSDQPRVLVGASSKVASSVEMHTTVVDQQGASGMQQLQQIEIPARGMVQFQPAGKHLMFIGLQQPLVMGEQVKVTLSFRNGETLQVPLTVQRSEPDSAHMDAMGHDAMGHDSMHPDNDHGDMHHH